MSLVVEDGTGLSNAESYISVADADAYHSNLGNAAWSAAGVTTAQKEAALRAGANYMLQAYRLHWQGLRRSPSQALDWPRMDVWVDLWPVASNIVPPLVANACAELALRALSASLNADLKQGVITRRVGPVETQYDKFSPQRVRYPAIDMMLAAYLAYGAGNARIRRA